MAMRGAPGQRGAAASDGIGFTPMPGPRGSEVVEVHTTSPPRSPIPAANGAQAGSVTRIRRRGNRAAMQHETSFPSDSGDRTYMQERGV